jgi:hypothetical protein
VKKQRGGSTPSASRSTASASASASVSASTSASSVAADDAIARRRAELRRLQQQRQSRSKSRPEVTSTSDLLANKASTASTGTASTGPPPRSKTNAAAAPAAAAPPAMPTQESIGRVRHSDLFPTVPKPPTAAATSTSTRTGKPPVAKSKVPPNATAAAARPPPPPPVARKLEFSATRSRAKSVPPARPPPPPRVPGQKAPPKEAPSRLQQQQQPPPSRRPAPVTPMSLLSTKAVATTTTATTTGPPKTTAVAADKAPPTFQVAAGETEAAAPQVKIFQPAEAPPTAAAAKTPGPHTSFAPSSKTTPLPGDAIPKPQRVQRVQTPYVKAPKGDSSPPPTDVKTPAPVANVSVTITKEEEPPSTVRRDRMRNLRDHLGDDPHPKTTTTTSTTNAFLTSEATSRLEQAYKKAEEEKQKAWKQVQELEQKLLQSTASATTTATTTTSTLPEDALQRMLQVADAKGEEAALQWARNQVSGVPPLQSDDQAKVGFMIPGSPSVPRNLLLNPETPVRRRVQSRTSTPYPKQHSGQKMVHVERDNLAHFREAAQCIPYEYQSKLATFIIRRPYGIDTYPTMFDLVSDTSPIVYARKAHVSTVSALEVAVTIAADNSVLLLFDTAGVRYRIFPNGDWKVVPNVDELDRPLGTVSYIDAEANEKDYSLDDVLEEALLVREQYCSTMTSTALGFQARPKDVVEAPPMEPQHASPPSIKPTTSEMGVDTSDIPFPPATIDVPNQDESKQTKEPVPAQVQKPKQLEEPESSSSSDVLAVFVGMIVQSIFGFIWWILVGLPMAIVKLSIVSMGALVLLAMVYLYALQEHNGMALHIGATTSSFFSNAPGIL